MKLADLIDSYLSRHRVAKDESLADRVVRLAGNDIIVIEGMSFLSLLTAVTIFRAGGIPAIASSKQYKQFRQKNIGEHVINEMKLLVLPRPKKLPLHSSFWAIATSGSTSSAKLAIIDSDSLLLRINRMACFYRERCSSRFISIIPASSSFGFHHFLLAMLRGEEFIELSLSKFGELVQALHSNVDYSFISSPSSMRLLVKRLKRNNQQICSANAVLLGGEIAHNSLHTQVSEVFPNTRLLDTYGTCETGFIAMKDCLNDDAFLVQYPNELKIKDGALFSLSKGLCAGYITLLDSNLTEFTPCNSPFSLRDLGKLSGDRLQVKGREAMQLRLNGVSTSIIDVEEMLRTKFPDADFRLIIDRHRGNDRLLVEYLGATIPALHLRNTLFGEGVEPSIKVSFECVDSFSYVEGKLDRISVLNS